jgi:hypothetical protein
MDGRLARPAVLADNRTVPMHHVEIVSQLERPHLEQLPALLAAATRADGHEPLGEHKFLRLRRGDDLGIAVLAYRKTRWPDTRTR